MALGKSIVKPTGHANTYWRLGELVLNVLGAGSQLRLAGYKDADTRAAPDALPDDGRNTSISHQKTLELAASNVLQHLAARGVDTSDWPAEVQTTLAATTLYDQIARVCYDAIKTAPRQTAVNIEGQEIVIQGSEFADAVDV